MLKKILIVLSVLVILALVLVVGAFFFVMGKLNSPSFAESIKTELRNKSGLELQFSEHSISLSKLVLKKVALPNPKSRDGENLLAIEEINLSYSLPKILKGSLDLPEVIITQPTIILRQSTEGGLILPVDLAQLKTKLAQAVGSTASTEPTPPSSGGFPVNAPNIKILAAQLSVFAADNSLLFQAENTNINAAFTQSLDQRSASGTLSTAKATVMPAILITDIKSPLLFEKGILSLSDLQGNLYNGTLKAIASLDTNPSPMTYQAKANLASVDMSSLMVGVGSDPQTLHGKLRLDFTGQGHLDAPKEIIANGTFDISETRVPKLESLKVLGSVLGINALKEGKFDAVDSTYTIAEQKVQLAPINIKSQNLNITLNGPIGFDKTLNLAGGVALDPNAMKMLITLAGIKTLEGGQTIPITLTGTTQEPKIRLDGQALDSVVAVLDPSKILAAPGQLLEGFLNKAKDSIPNPSNSSTPTDEKANILDVFNPFKSKPAAEPAPAQP
jgi:uncharacterized protein involved in outer membrane biogenesis